VLCKPRFWDILVNGKNVKNWQKKCVASTHYVNRLAGENHARQPAAKTVWGLHNNFTELLQKNTGVLPLYYVTYSAIWK
jgi:hypothetical protein